MKADLQNNTTQFSPNLAAGKLPPSGWVLASDLDATIFPNGPAPDDGALPALGQIISARRVRVVFATGRTIEEVQAGIAAYHPPLPERVYADIGTRLFRLNHGNFEEDIKYRDWIIAKTPGWDVARVRREVSTITDLSLQAAQWQGPFKAAFLFEDLSRLVPLGEEVACRVRSFCEEISVIASADPVSGIGTLDVIPRSADKRGCLTHFEGECGVTKQELVYAGDNWNDISALTAGYHAILVRNAKELVKEQVRHIAQRDNLVHRLYIAQGLGRLNGNYAAGVIEGLVHFGFVQRDGLGGEPSVDNPVAKLQIP